MVPLPTPADTRFDERYLSRYVDPASDLSSLRFNLHFVHTLQFACAWIFDVYLFPNLLVNSREVVLGTRSYFLGILAFFLSFSFII